MGMQSATQLLDLRVWRDERLDQRWRVTYNDGDGETIVAFPDTAALGDFIMERLGLRLIDDPRDLPVSRFTYPIDEWMEVDTWIYTS